MICGFLCLAYFTYNIFKVQPRCDSISTSLPPWLGNIPLHGYATLCSSTHQLMDIRVVSTSYPLWTMQLQTFLSKPPELSWVPTWKCNDCPFLHSASRACSLPSIRVKRGRRHGSSLPPSKLPSGFLHAVHLFNKHVPGTERAPLNKHTQVPAFMELTHTKSR